MIAEIVIDGGPQTIIKGVYDHDLMRVVAKPVVVNPGAEKRLSFQALLALIIATSIGQLRPHRLVAGTRAYAAYKQLLRDTVGAEETNEDPSFADIRMVERKDMPTDCIVAIGERIDTNKLTNQYSGIRRLGRLSGIDG